MVTLVISEDKSFSCLAEWTRFAPTRPHSLYYVAVFVPQEAEVLHLRHFRQLCTYAWSHSISNRYQYMLNWLDLWHRRNIYSYAVFPLDTAPLIPQQMVTRETRISARTVECVSHIDKVKGLPTKAMHRCPNMHCRWWNCSCSLLYIIRYGYSHVLLCLSNKLTTIWDTTTVKMSGRSRIFIFGKYQNLTIDSAQKRSGEVAAAVKSHT